MLVTLCSWGTGRVGQADRSLEEEVVVPEFGVLKGCVQSFARLSSPSSRVNQPTLPLPHRYSSLYREPVSVMRLNGISDVDLLT